MRPTTEFWRDPSLPHVESRRACDSRACYRPHSHDTFSIGAVDAGRSVFSGASSGTRLLQAGSVVAVPAGCVHACNPMPGHAWSYQMLHLDADWLGSLRDESSPPPSTRHLGVVHVSDDRTRYRDYCTLNTLLFSDATVEEKDAALIAFVGDLEQPPGTPVALGSDAASLHHRLQPAMAQLRGQLSRTPPLAELATAVHMSRYQLIRAFRRATGLTPHAWQMDQRIRQARLQLRDGEAMASVAHGLGFADQSHFQRVFKAHAATTPGHYRR